MTQDRAEVSKVFLEAVGYSEVTAHVYMVTGVVQKNEVGDPRWCVTVNDAAFRCVDMLSVVSIAAERFGYVLEAIDD